MGRFLEAAYRVLRETGKPLSAKAITDQALRQGFLETGGQTPWQTMKSKLSTNILERRDASTFMRTAQGEFALREWKETLDEYVADRYVKSLLAEEVVVFPAVSLPKYIARPGLHPVTIANGRDLIAECRPMHRIEAEEDFSVIQLVSVFLVRYRHLYLTYKRTKRLPESRLHGYYSMIFGGHLNPEDIPSLFNIFDPREGRAFIDRELREELRLAIEEGSPTLLYRGILYDDSRALSRQHLGIVYEVALRSMNYEIGERGFLMDSKFESLQVIDSRRADFENWSLLLLDHELECAEGRNSRECLG